MGEIAVSDQDVNALLREALEEARPLAQEGKVASYIPALAQVPRARLGVALEMADGRSFAAGDADTPFSIQSVSKVFSLAFALDAVGPELWGRVGREPSGMAFNSMTWLELEGGKPRNPFVNAGALVVWDALLGADAASGAQFLGRMQALAGGSAAITCDETVRASEEGYGDLNRAIAWMLRAKGNLRAHPDQVTGVYFAACATAASCRSLAKAARFLIGVSEAAPVCRDAERLRRIHAVMRTCGLYDAAGDFAFRVGLPAKSGVGGGVLAIAPGRYAAVVWSPALDAKGNSVAGVAALERLTSGLGR